MKGPLETARTREYPHLVRRDGRRLVRTDLVVGNGPVAGMTGSQLSLGVPGTLDRIGRLTDRGRQGVLAAQRAAAAKSRQARCIVWALDDCTWIDPDGVCTHDTKPPEAEHTLNAYRYAAMPVQIEHCWTVDLPPGCRHAHICVVPIDGRRVEIAGGEPLLLGTFDEPVAAGERDPAGAYLDEDGGFRPPVRFRGQPVTKVEDWTIYGPVQPVEDGIVLRDPWPGEVAAACERIAGGKLDAATLAKVWQAVNPDLAYNPVGVLKAA